MTCQEFQELLTAAADQVLPTQFQEAFSEHARKCFPCRNEFELESATKAAVALHVRMLPIPTGLLDAVRTALALEGAASGPEHPSWWSRLWSGAYMKPFIGFAVACVAVLLILARAEHRPEGGTALPAEANVIIQSLSNYHAVVNGNIKPQMISSEPELLRRFFSGKTEFSVFIPAMKECTLVGGVVNDFSGTMLAHVMYRHDSGIVYMYQACWNTVMKGDKLRLPEEAKVELQRTGWFTETHPDGDTVVLWRKGNTLCAAVARMSKQNLIACLTSENAGNANAW